MKAGDGDRPLKLAIIAGEVSGDRLAADLIGAIRLHHPGDVSVVGVGGEAMEGEGLRSFFDYSELSIVGIGAVVARLPQLLYRIRQTARMVLAEYPDVLVIVDSPDFTHRVARRVRAARPELPIIDYVSPSVWAWKPERAPAMSGYIDHVLSILPFEPAVLEALGGPPTTYVGHRLVFDTQLLSARAEQHQRRRHGTRTGTCMLLPGSRSGELKRMLPLFRQAAVELAERNPSMRFVMPAVRRHHDTIRQAVEAWPVKPEILLGDEAKWRGFAEADGAIATSGTVLLELALAGVPCVSAYKLDIVARMIVDRITTWSAALPNLIVGYPVIPEYFNESARANRLARHVERLMQPTLERQAMLEGFDAVRRAMAVMRTPDERAAEIVLGHARAGRRGPA